MRRALLALLAALACVADAEGATDCRFERTGTTLRLLADCTTDASIVIPDGMTLDGANHTITAVDPPGGHFRGGILTNGGRSASIVDTRLTARALAGVCDAGDDRLRGIFLNGASGEIRGNTVLEVHQGASACQEGNAVEVWNGAGSPVAVEIVDNVIGAYQKSGVVVSGHVEATIRGNSIGASAAQAQLAANAVQIGFGAWALVEHNEIEGNRWLLPDAAATAILLSGSSASTTVRRNVIHGSADIGIYVAASEAIVTGNRLSDAGPDGFYDIGIVDAGDANRIAGNEVRGFGRRYLGVGRQDGRAPGAQAWRRGDGGKGESALEVRVTGESVLVEP